MALKGVLLMAVCFSQRVSAEGIVRNDDADAVPTVSATSVSGRHTINLRPSEADERLVDSLFFQDALAVTFPVNRTEFSLDRFPKLRQFLDDVKPLLQSSTTSFSFLRIRSAASPEGPYWNNRRLARERGEALLRLLRSYGIPLDNMRLDNVDEDYELLAFHLRQAHDADAPLVDSLYNKYGRYPDLLKRHLQAAQHGRLWQRLLKSYYPALRASRFMLVVQQRLEQLGAIEPVAMTVPEAQLSAPLPIVPLPPASFQPQRPKRRELLSVKTNLLQDVAYVPQYGFCPLWNVAVEYYPLHGHYTYGASLDCPWWQRRRNEHKYFQVRNYQLDVRRYFRADGVFRGWYAQAYVNGGLYGVGFSKQKGWQGEAAGLGLGGGYVLPVCRSQHWRLEFQLQMGVMVSKYDPYVYGCPVENVEDGRYYYNYRGDADLFKKRQYRYTYFGPTRIGLTLTYDLLYRRRTK